MLLHVHIANILILKICIMQGSVATQLGCSGIFSDHFIITFHRMCRWKKFENRPVFGDNMDQKLAAYATLLGHRL